MFLIVVALIATNMTAYTFTQISEIVKFENSKKESFNKMMIGINFQMRANGLCMNLQQRVRKFFEFKYQQNQLINQLPEHLKEEVLLDLNKDIIYVHLFKDLSQQCQKQICLSMKQRQLTPDEIIVNQKELNECLFYLTHGNLEVICTVQRQNNMAFYNNHYKLKKKDCFGYEGFILGEISPYSVKSIGSSIVSYIEKQILIGILKQFPKDYEKFTFMKDKALFSLTAKSSLKFKCISCGQLDHHFLKCPYLTLQMRYKPCNQINMRNSGFRRRQEKFNYNYCGMSSLQDIAMAVVVNNDKTLMLEAVDIFKSQVIQEFSEDYDNQSQNSQSCDFINSNSNLIQKSILNNNQQNPKHDQANHYSENVLPSQIAKSKKSKKQQKAASNLELHSLDFIKIDQLEQQEIYQKDQKYGDLQFNKKIRQLKSQDQLVYQSVPQVKFKDQNKPLANNVQSFKSLKLLEDQQQKEKKKVQSSENLNPNSLINAHSDDMNEFSQKNEQNQQQEFQSNQQEFQQKQEEQQKNQHSKNTIHKTKSMIIDQGEMGLLKQVFEKRQQRAKQMIKGLNKYVHEKILLKQIMHGQVDQFHHSKIESLSDNQNEQNKNSVHSKYDQMPQRNNFFNLIQQLNSSLKNNPNNIQSHIQSNQEIKLNDLDNKTDDQQSPKSSNPQQNFDSIRTSNQHIHVHRKSKEIFETTELKIRCERNLQDLDMLVIRKKFLLLQQQNIFHNFIEVPDNEIDIDIYKEYFYYFHNHNLQIVLNNIKIKQEAKLKANRKEVKRKTSLSKKRNTKKYRYSNENSPIKVKNNKKKTLQII